MMRVVLDANVLVSAIPSPRGVPAQILNAWRAEQSDLVMSHAILAELDAVPACLPSVCRCLAITHQLYGLHAREPGRMEASLRTPAAGRCARHSIRPYKTSPRRRETEMVHGRLAALSAHWFPSRACLVHLRTPCGPLLVGVRASNNGCRKRNRQPLSFCLSSAVGREASASPLAKGNKKRSHTTPTLPWAMADWPRAKRTKSLRSFWYARRLCGFVMFANYSLSGGTSVRSKNPFAFKARARVGIRTRECFFLDARGDLGSGVGESIYSLTPTGRVWANMQSKIASAFKRDNRHYQV